MLRAFGRINHYIHRQRRSAVNAFISKRSVRTVQPNILHIVDDLCTRMSQCASTQDVLDAKPPLHRVVYPISVELSREQAVWIA